MCLVGRNTLLNQSNPAAWHLQVTKSCPAHRPILAIVKINAPRLKGIKEAERLHVV